MHGLSRYRFDRQSNKGLVTGVILTGFGPGRNGFHYNKKELVRFEMEVLRRAIWGELCLENSFGVWMLCGFYGSASRKPLPRSKPGLSGEKGLL